MEAGGWVEEVFYSLLRIGFYYEQLATRSANKQLEVTEADEKKRNKKRAIYSISCSLFSKAWEYRPTRAEPLYQLARMYRLKSQNNIALMYALQGENSFSEK